MGLPFATNKKKTTEQNVTSNSTSPVGHLDVNDTTELDEVDSVVEPDLEGKTTTSASSLKYLALLCLLLPLTCCVLAVYFVAR